MSNSPTTSQIPVPTDEQDDMVSIDEYIRQTTADWEDTQTNKNTDKEDQADSKTIYADYSALMRKNITVFEGNDTKYVESSMQVFYAPNPSSQDDGKRAGDGDDDDIDNEDGYDTGDLARAGDSEREEIEGGVGATGGEGAGRSCNAVPGDEGKVEDASAVRSRKKRVKQGFKERAGKRNEKNSGESVRESSKKKKTDK
eukprot:764315-Hanusia_phi.AAC.3